MRAATHLFDDQKRTETVAIRFATSRRAGRAHAAIQIQAGAENRRVTHAPGDLPGQAAGSGDAADFALAVDAVAIDRAVVAFRSEQPLSEHFHRGAATGFRSLLRIEIVRWIDTAFPIEPKLARVRGVQIVFDLKSHAAGKILRAFP